MKRTSHRKGQSGLTIVEVLIAAVLMIVSIFGLLAIFPQALGRARNSGRMLILDQLSSEKLESLRALDYGSADLVPGLHPAQQSDSKGRGLLPDSRPVGGVLAAMVGPGGAHRSERQPGTEYENGHDRSDLRRSVHHAR